MIDFLVWQGYTKGDVDGMTFRQVILFMDVANKRMQSIYGQAGTAKSPM